MKKYFTTQGRVGRLEYFGVTMLIAVISIIPIIGIILIPVLLYVAFCLVAKRAHDFDKSGWLGLITLIPPLNLFFLFKKGTDGENQYGPDPSEDTQETQTVFKENKMKDTKQYIKEKTQEDFGKKDDLSTQKKKNKLNATDEYISQMRSKTVDKDN